MLLSASSMAVASANSVGAGADTRTKVSQQNAEVLAVPECVRRWSTTNYAYARNNCSGSHSLRFKWSLAPDSDCVTLRPGYQAHHERPNFASRFEGLASC